MAERRRSRRCRRRVAALGEFGLIDAGRGAVPDHAGRAARAGRRRGRRGRAGRPRGRHDRPARRGAALPPRLVDARTRSAARPPRRTWPTSWRWARGRPRCSSASACPADLPVDWATGLADGLAEECALVGATVVGGDVVRSDAGGGRGDRPRRPRGPGAASPGPGRGRATSSRSPGGSGWAAAGLAVLGRGFRSPRVLADAHRVPCAAVRRGRAAARWRVPPRCSTCRTGCVQDAGHVAAASGVVLALRHRAARGRRSRSPTRPRRSTPTRSSGCCAAATTTRCSRRSPPGRRCRRASPRSARSARGTRPPCSSTARPATGPGGHDHFRASTAHDDGRASVVRRSAR